ncbi:uncharacterized protein [Nicotiana tomentosiformis]|uniref:uncharacterized protein n=1 Tax=Nicotiana tomentosiformis TaxID=4098 RepID=UPI00388C92ED
MEDDEQRRLERFGRLRPPSFNGTELEDAQGFWISASGWWEYEMRFSELARHAVWLVLFDRDRIRRFIDGLTYQLRLLMTRERVSGATFDEVVDIARQLEGQSSLSAIPAQSTSRAPSVQGSSVLNSSGSYSGSQGPPQNSPPFFERDCYECGELGHVRKYCPCLMRGPVEQISHVMTFVPIAPPPTQPARGGAQSASGRPRGRG